MTTQNARMNEQAKHNAQIRVLAMQYAIGCRPEGPETTEALLARAEAIYDFMKDTTAAGGTLEVVKTFPGA